MERKGTLIDGKERVGGSGVLADRWVRVGLDEYGRGRWVDFGFWPSTKIIGNMHNDDGGCVDQKKVRDKLTDTEQRSRIDKTGEKLKI